MSRFATAVAELPVGQVLDELDARLSEHDAAVLEAPEQDVVLVFAVREGLDVEAKEYIRRGSGSEMRKCRAVIATAAGLAQIGRIDVLIRADGGVGLPSEQIYNIVIGKWPVSIIDFLDKHHPQLLARSKKRKLAYKQAGYNIVDDNRTQLQKFIDQRPKVEKVDM